MHKLASASSVTLSNPYDGSRSSPYCCFGVVGRVADRNGVRTIDRELETSGTSCDSLRIVRVVTSAKSVCVDFDTSQVRPFWPKKRVIRR
jgi:hypothetical protein